MYYKHFKGGFYKKINESRKSQDCTIEYITYKSLQKTDYKKGQLWTRDKKEFYDSKNGVKRFRKLNFTEIIMLLLKLKKYIK